MQMQYAENNRGKIDSSGFSGVFGSNSGTIEIILRSSRIYLGLLAPCWIPPETAHLKKNIQLPPGSTSIFLKLSASFSIFQYYPVTFRFFDPLPVSS
jgi:hypothetical protein